MGKKLIRGTVLLQFRQKKASSVNVLRIRAVVPNKGALKRKGVPRLIEPEPFILVNLSL